MNKLILAITAVIIAAAGFFFFFNKDSAPNVTFQTLDGGKINTEELKGKVVLVKFWATTCVTCVKQMPDTIEYYNTYKDKGYDTIAVAMSYDNTEALHKFRESYQLPFTVAYDKSGQIATDFGGIRFTPVSFLIDRDGNIVKRYIGEYDKKEFIQTLEKTLAQK